MDIGEVHNSGEEKIVPMRRETFPAVSGRFARKLRRAQTVHLDGVCPVCGGRARWQKDIPLVNGKYDHEKWVCKKCHSKFDRKDLKNVKYV